MSSKRDADLIRSVRTMRAALLHTSRLSALVCFLGMFTALAPPASATFTSYEVTGTVDSVDPGVPFTVGESFTLTFTIDDSRPQTGFGGPDLAGYEDAIVGPSIEFSGGHFLEADLAEYSGFDSPSSDPQVMYFQVIQSNAGFSTSLPLSFPEPGTAEPHNFYRFTFSVVDPTGELFSNVPPEIVAPDPATAFASQGIVQWNDPDGVGMSRAVLAPDTLTIVPEPASGLLHWLALVALAAVRRSRSTSV